MKNIYAPLTSDQFDQIYRFGELHFPEYLTVEAQEVNEDLQNSLVQLFSTYLPFVYDEDYLVVKACSDFIEEKRLFHIKIKDIKAIYPISEEGEKALVLKKSNKIRFSPPLFSKSQYAEINDSFFTAEAKKGAECLAYAFKKEIKEDTNTASKLEETISASLKVRNNVRINDLTKDSPLVDFTFLYIYQAYYPLSTLGYFFRTAEILARKAFAEKGFPYNPSILEGSDIYKFLLELHTTDPNILLKDIVEKLEKDVKAQRFVENLTIDGLRLYVTIPMFLKVIDEFNEKNQQIANTSLQVLIKHYKEKYPLECHLLILWLGCYLGYGNCYDFYYDKLNLRFFKGYQPAAFNVVIKSHATDSPTSAEDANMKTQAIPFIITNLEQKGEEPGENNENIEASVTPTENNEILVASDISTDPNQNESKANGSLLEFIEKMFKDNNQQIKAKDILTKLKAGGFKDLHGEKLDKKNLENFLKNTNIFKKEVKGKIEYFEIRNDNSLFSENDSKPNSLADITG